MGIITSEVVARSIITGGCRIQRPASQVDALSFTTKTARRVAQRHRVADPDDRLVPRLLRAHTRNQIPCYSVIDGALELLGAGKVLKRLASRPLTKGREDA